jgi:hypothetical protein
LDSYFDIPSLTDNNHNADRTKAIKYLIAGGYLSIKIIQTTPYAAITQKGANAYHSEYFLEQHKDYIAKRTEKRIMIWCNIVVALGVLYTLYRDNFISNKPSKELTQILTRLTDQNTDSTSVQKSIFQAQTFKFPHIDTVKKGLP